MTEEDFLLDAMIEEKKPSCFFFPCTCFHGSDSAISIAKMTSNFPSLASILGHTAIFVVTVSPFAVDFVCSF